MRTDNFNVDQLLADTFKGINIADEANANEVADLLDKFNLRWDVSKQPLNLPSGEFTGFYGVVRDDKNITFSTCKEGYLPYQNSELAELLIRISEKTGYEIHSGGMFNDGAKVYLQLNTGNEITNLGENRTSVKGYATGINSHDGTTALKWGAVNFTICCGNTFAMAQKALQQSARHTNSMHDKIEASIKQINGIAEAEKTIFDQFIKLAEIPVQKSHIAEIVKQVTEVDILLPTSQAKEKFSTYAINRSNDLLKSIASETRVKGQTLWGLFSGITHYTSHVLPVPKRTNARLESKYTGTALNIDNAAFTKILDYAN